MVYHREKLDSGIVKTTIDGIMNLELSLSSLDDLTRYINNNRLFEAVIHTKNAGINVSYDEATPLITKAQEIFNSLEAGAVAFVADTDMMFGLCRQLQLQLESEKMQLAVFRKEESAMQWLQEIKDSV